jgi:hypothetical protein
MTATLPRPGTAATGTVDRPPARAWAGVLGGMTTFGVVAFNDGVWRRWFAAVPWLPRWLYQASFATAVAEHVRKAAVANRLAKDAAMDPQLRAAWTRQTLVLGFPSLRLLQRQLGDQG